MERQFFSGNTIEQAVMAAARHYGLDPSRVAYSLRDKKHGFLNIRRRVVIEVDPAAPEKPEPVPEPAAEPAREEWRGREPLGHVAEQEEPHGEQKWPDHAAPAGIREEFLAEHSGSEADRETAAFERALGEVVALLDLQIEGTVQKSEDLFEIELSGPDSHILVESEGRTLRAIEHLLPRLVRGLLDYGLPCRVDCNGFQENRASELREQANDQAEIARQEGREQKLEPMSPADRRIVHMALADDPAVRTESEGEGYLKRVRILPA